MRHLMGESLWTPACNTHRQACPVATVGYTEACWTCVYAVYIFYHLFSRNSR